MREIVEIILVHLTSFMGDGDSVLVSATIIVVFKDAILESNQIMQYLFTYCDSTLGPTCACMAGGLSMMG